MVTYGTENLDHLYMSTKIADQSHKKYKKELFPWFKFKF